MTKYFKIVNSKYGNYGWKYSVGIHDLNDNEEIFDTVKQCGAGGLYYTTPKYILDYYYCGDTLCEIIPHGQIIKMGDKYKTNKLEIISMFPLNELSTWDFMIKNGTPCNNIHAFLWLFFDKKIQIIKRKLYFHDK